jgi:hypothetical protein
MEAKINLDQFSYSRVVTGLRNIADKVPENARKTMRRAAERIVKKAKLYVPEDSGALMESIRLEASYGTRGRLQINVVVGGEGSVTVSGREISLDRYAAIIHEAYESMLVYGPGERTLEKMAANPGKVGSRFLTRAAAEEETILQRDMVQSITDTIKSEGL